MEILLASTRSHFTRSLMDSLGEVVFIKSNMNVGDFIDDQWTEKKTGRCTCTELQ